MKYLLGPLCFWLLFLPVQAQAAEDNLLIITVDTLRADRLSAYGYTLNQTPHIDRWAKEGVLFERAYAEVPLTRPSHSSLLTGTLPFYHGVRDNGGFILPEAQLTLAEILKASGFQTAGFVSSYVLESRFGMAQGFDHYDDEVGTGRQDVISPASLRRAAPETTERFLEWLEKHRQNRFFVWLHYYDPHAPCAEGYDREVSRVDESIGEVDRKLREWNLLDNTHVFFLSDHGESLGEHGESGHGFFVYDSTLRIPWIYRPSRSFKPATSRVEIAFSLMDVFPTALQSLGLPNPSHVQGRSAVRALLGKETRQQPLYAESYLPWIQFGWSPLRCLRVGGMKLVDAPRPELYNPNEDLLESVNLFSGQQALGRRLQEELKDFVSRFSPSDSGSASTTPVDSETAQKLAALGYVAVASPRLDEDYTGSPDPKDRIRLYEEYQELLSVMHGPPPPDIFKRIADMRSQDPGIRGLDLLEAIAAERSGQLARAVELYLLAIEEDPANQSARSNLGSVYVRMGRLGEAEESYREALKMDPADYRSRNNLGMLLRLKGESADSLEHFRRVTAEAPEYVPGWVNLGLGLAQAGELAEAEKSLRRAVSLDGQNAQPHYHLSEVLSKLGLEAEARQELQLARQLDARRGKK